MHLYNISKHQENSHDLLFTISGSHYLFVNTSIIGTHPY